MKKTLLTKTLLLLFALIAGSSSSWAVDQVYKSLTFPDDNSASNGLTTLQYESTWTATIGTTSWTIVNFNNNNWTNSWTYIKCGRKKGKSANTPSVASITTSAAIDEAITKVVVTLTAINASDYNSIKLYMASNSAFDANLETITVDPIPTSAGLMTITIPEAKRAANRFYKIEFDTKGTTSSNGHTGVTKVEYYYNQVSSANLDHIELGGTYVTEFYVGDTFTHDGLTVTAHYDDASSLDVTSSATFSVPDMSTPGTKTITVSYEENSITKTATYDITVKPVASAVVTLDFTTNAWGFPTEKAEGPVTYTNQGYSIILQGSSGQGYYFDADTNNLLLGKTGATLTLPAFGFNVSKIKVYGTDAASGSVKFNIFVGGEAVSTEVTSSKVTQQFAIAAEKQAVGTVYVIKVTNNNNMRITKIEVFGNGCEAGVVTDAGWATYVTSQAMRFAEGEAFAVTAAGSGSVTLAEVTDVPNNFPVLLKGEGAKTALVLETSPAAPANELSVSTGGEINGYVLANKEVGVGFYKWAGGSLTSGKVYLPASVVAGAPDFLGFGGDATGIDEVRGKTEEVRGEFYNLAGQRVAQPTKGLYIVNGKKVVMK